MNKLAKIIVGVFCALLLATATPVLGQNGTNGPSIVAVEKSPASLFNGGEFGLSIASGYTLDTATLFSPSSKVIGTGTVKSLFKDPYTLNFNAGAFWFPWRNLGFEANVPFYQSKGVSVDEVQAGLVLRLPLAKTTPFFRNLSPYVGADGVYGWDATEKWSYIGKAGLEVRLNKKWGVFVEGQYRNYEFQNWGTHGQVSLNGGLHLIF